ncbi:MAG: serine/threonine-protein kinase [Planctomycetota bacterium]|nr:serine/threonine-protein kinase [Planctomycetota bacterium]
MGSTDRIAGYELVEWLGDGAWGAIYRAHQLSLDRPVVLKVMRPEIAEDETRKAAILAEARRVARVAHTHLVCGLDVGEVDGRPYFAMEAAEGRTVEDHLKDHGRLPERQTLRVGAKIARALHATHAGLLVHRGVRLRSLLITNQGVPKLTDLGPASLESARDLADEGHASTAWYVSPEIVRGETSGDPASDLYALGACLFHMLAGVPPFDGDTPEAVREKHVMSPPPSLRALVPSISEATDAILKRCLAKRASDRYLNGKELADALEAAATTQARTAPVAQAPAAPVTGGGSRRATKGQAPVTRRQRRRRRR